MFSLAGINWLAVVVGVVVSNALGFLWYGPLFGQTWAKALGKKMEELQGSPTMYVVTIVASFITMVVLAAAVAAFGSANLIEGAVVGALLWFGIGATQSYVGATFEGRPMAVWQISALYNLVVFVVMGAVFAAW
ncbi:MAG: DUF1761 domain-containing protein [Anaerolineales bacterium]